MTTPPPHDFLRRWTRRINATLRRALPVSAPIADAMRYAVFSGGKRFRPLLCLAACRAVGGSVRQALDPACAIELIHSYSLVHDDLPAMDDATTRRGRPTCHRRYGEATAILAGDALLTRAFEWLARDGTPNALAIIRALGHACGTMGLVGGQALDLQALDRRRPSSAAFLTDVARRKTGALITASVVTGALAGGGSHRELATLRQFGQDLGLAFQLLDDARDGDGVARVVGHSAAKQEARRLLDRAERRLEPFGGRAQALQALTAWLWRIA